VWVLDVEATAGRVEVGGPDVLTYREMMQTYAEVAGLRRRVIVPVPVLTPKLSSLWVGLVTPLPTGLARPLVESLVNEVVVQDDTRARLMPRDHAPVPRGGPAGARAYQGPGRRHHVGEAARRDRPAAGPAPPRRAVGGRGHRLLARRGDRPSPPAAAARRDEGAGGGMWLEFRGLGSIRAYWYALVPFHSIIFPSMARRLAHEAERLAADAHGVDLTTPDRARWRRGNR
jgi:hypothetical protein